MILYHFCSKKHLAGIQRSGIALGVIPWKMLQSGQVTFVRGYQWLTSNPDWCQSWDRDDQAKLTYRRTEYRIALEVPNFALNNLIKWTEMAERKRPDSSSFLNSFPDHKHWYLFNGPIPTSWFLSTDRNPTPINLPGLNENN